MRSAIRIFGAITVYGLFVSAIIHLMMHEREGTKQTNDEEKEIDETFSNFKTEGKAAEIEQEM